MKVRTEMHAGQCPGNWSFGVVRESSGGGYFGSLIGEDGQRRFFNNGYTSFCPFRQGVQVGQRVMFALFQPPNERAGKVACIAPAPM